MMNKTAPIRIVFDVAGLVRDISRICETIPPGDQDRGLGSTMEFGLPLP